MEGARPEIALIVTDFGQMSHGNWLGTQLLTGARFADRTEAPRCNVVAMHLMEIAGEDSYAGPDVGIAIATRHGLPLYPSVASALCRGGETLAVDGVVILAEHGSWPEDDEGRLRYPRRELLDQVVGVFRQAGRSVPVFNDKELSWSWSWAQHMWRQVQELKIPFFAGSSIPWAAYHPRISLPHGRRLGHVVVVGYAELNRYAVHAIELGQSLMEARLGGEVGVARVRCRDDVPAEVVAREIPKDLLGVALALREQPTDLASVWGDGSVAIDVAYRDGPRLTVLLVNPGVPRFSFAFRTDADSSITAAAYTEAPGGPHGAALVRAIEQLMIDRRSPIAPERVLLTTGVLAYAFLSRSRGGMWVDTPDLAIEYLPRSLPSAWTEVLR